MISAPGWSRLSLTCNGLTDVGATDLLAHVPSYPKLLFLDLRGNHLTTYVQKPALDAVRKHPYLQRIDLGPGLGYAEVTTCAPPPANPQPAQPTPAGAPRDGSAGLQPQEKKSRSEDTNSKIPGGKLTGRAVPHNPLPRRLHSWNENTCPEILNAKPPCATMLSAQAPGDRSLANDAELNSCRGSAEDLAGGGDASDLEHPPGMDSLVGCATICARQAEQITVGLDHQGVDLGKAYRGDVHEMRLEMASLRQQVARLEQAYNKVLERTILPLISVDGDRRATGSSVLVIISASVQDQPTSTCELSFATSVWVQNAHVARSLQQRAILSPQLLSRSTEALPQGANSFAEQPVPARQPVEVTQAAGVPLTSLAQQPTHESSHPSIAHGCQQWGGQESSPSTQQDGEVESLPAALPPMVNRGQPAQLGYQRNGRLQRGQEGVRRARDAGMQPSYEFESPTVDAGTQKLPPDSGCACQVAPTGQNCLVGDQSRQTNAVAQSLQLQGVTGVADDMGDRIGRNGEHATSSEGTTATCEGQPGPTQSDVDRVVQPSALPDGIVLGKETRCIAILQQTPRRFCERGDRTAAVGAADQNPYVQIPVLQSQEDQSEAGRCSYATSLQRYSNSFEKAYPVVDGPSHKQLVDRGSAGQVANVVAPHAGNGCWLGFRQTSDVKTGPQQSVAQMRERVAAVAETDRLVDKLECVVNDLAQAKINDCFKARLQAAVNYLHVIGASDVEIASASVQDTSID